MLPAPQRDLATLLFEANALISRLQHGDLSVSAPLAGLEFQLRELAAAGLAIHATRQPLNRP